MAGGAIRLRDRDLGQHDDARADRAAVRARRRLHHRGDLRLHANNPDRAERLGVLVASGLIVGESLFGVLNAGLIVALNTDAPLALVPETFAPANALGLITFSVLVVLLYKWMLRRVIT